MNYFVRKLNKSDYNKNYFELLKQLTSIDPNKISKSNFNKMLEGLGKKHLIYVIEDLKKNIIIGSITILVEKKIIHNLGTVIHIEDVVIHKDYRKKGLSNKLINLSKEIAKKNKAYKIILNCSDSLELFYNKHGFKKKNIQMALYN